MGIRCAMLVLLHQKHSQCAQREAYAFLSRLDIGFRPVSVGVSVSHCCLRAIPGVTYTMSIKL
jgi:hypothetical protein